MQPTCLEVAEKIARTTGNHFRHRSDRRVLGGVVRALKNLWMGIALLVAFTVDVVFAVGPNAIPVALQESKSTVAADTGFWDNNDPGSHQTDLLWFQSKGKNSSAGWNIYKECGFLGLPLWHPQHVVRMPNKNGRAYFMVSQSDQGGGFISVLETKAGSLDPVTDLILPNNTANTNGDITGQEPTAGPDSNGVGNFIWSMGFPSNGNNPIGEWNHPCQMQVVGDVLAVVAQNFDSDCLDSDGLGSSDDSILFFDIREPALPVYLGLMSAPELGLQYIDQMGLGRTPDGDYVLMAGGEDGDDDRYHTHRISTHLSTDVADWKEIPGGDSPPHGGLPKYKASLASQHGSFINSYQRVNSTAGEFAKGEERLVSFDTQYATGDYSTTPPKYSNSPLSPTFHELSETQGWMPAHDGTIQYQLSDGYYYDYRSIPYAYTSGLPTDGFAGDVTLNGDDNGEWVWAKDSVYITTYGMPVIYTVTGDHDDGVWGTWIIQLASYPTEVYRPGNDSFSDAIALSSSDLVYGDTAAVWPLEKATREPGEPIHAGGQSGSLWWSYTPLSDGTLSLDTYGSDFETTLAVYTGATVSSLTPIASNNGVPFDAVGFQVESNVTYYIAVDGEGANSYGEVRLKHLTTSGTIRSGGFDATTNSAINVSWIPENFASNTEFNVQRLSPFDASVSSGWSTNTSWTSAGLLPNIPYFFNVTARTDTGTNLITTLPVELGSAFSQAAPPVPGGLILVGERTIDVSWTANGNPTANNAGGTWYYVENQTAGTESGWITNTVWQSTGLTRGTTNSFRIKARNGNYIETDWVDLGALSTADPVPVWYVSTTGNDAADGQSWATAKETIQAAIDESDPGNTVLVSNGVYQTGGRVAFTGSGTNRVVINKAISLVSVNGPEVTTIQGAWDPATTNGASAIRGVYMAEGSMLSGFTVTNGATLSGGTGGGVYAGSDSAVVVNCVLSGNSADYAGGGVYKATLYNSTLAGNSAGGYGGGAYASTLNDCVLQGNSAADGGGARSYGGVNPDDIALNNCTLLGNTADQGGGRLISR